MKKTILKIALLLYFFTSSISCLSNSQTFLVFGGKTGWIGQKMVALLKKSGHEAICAKSRLENREGIIRELKKYKPNFIINAAGITGRPNVDWCERNRQQTIRTNVVGTLNLADVAFLHGIHVTNLSTGCLYNYDEKHRMGSGVGFKEEDKPNSIGSFYARSKIPMEKLLLEYPNVLNLRIKMPVSSDMNPRSFVGKLIGFKKVVNFPNSITVLDDLLPVAIQMALRGITGNYNFANPGTLTHHEVLDLYKKYIDPNFTYQGFSAEEQEKISKNRSNCELDVSKLLKEFPNIPPIKKSITSMFEKAKLENKNNERKS